MKRTMKLTTLLIMVGLFSLTGCKKEETVVPDTEIDNHNQQS